MSYHIIDLDKCILHHAGKSKFKNKWCHYERTFHETILYIIIEGTLYLKVNNKPFKLNPGDAILMPPGTHHVGYDEAEVSFFWLHCIFDDSHVLDKHSAINFIKNNTAPQKIVLPSHFHLHESGKFIILMHQLIHYILDDYTNHIIPYLFKAALIELSNQNIELTHMIQFKNRRFQEIVAYIHGNFREELSVRQLAERFQYNEKYLVKLFKEHFGMTTIEYINHVRLEYCELRLLETSDTISAIAHDGGFKNEFYFMRCFKKKYDVSPTHYRNTYHLQRFTKYQL